MRGNGSLSEILDLAGLADVDTMHADLAIRITALPCGERLQPGLVAVGEREIAAAPGQFQRQCAADAAGSAGHGGGTSGYRSHVDSMEARVTDRELAKNCVFPDIGKLEPNHKAVSALNPDGSGATPKRRRLHGTIETLARDRTDRRGRPDAAGNRSE